MKCAHAECGADLTPAELAEKSCPKCRRGYCAAHFAADGPKGKFCAVCKTPSCAWCAPGGTCFGCLPKCAECDQAAQADKQCHGCGKKVCGAHAAGLQSGCGQPGCASVCCAGCKVDGKCIICYRKSALKSEVSRIVAAAGQDDAPPDVVVSSCAAGQHTPPLWRTDSPTRAAKPGEDLTYGQDLALCPLCRKDPSEHAAKLKETLETKAAAASLMQKLAANPDPARAAFMMGVLICRNAQGELVTLAAVSGRNPAGFSQAVEELGFVAADKVEPMRDIAGRILYPPPSKGAGKNPPGQCAAPKLLQTAIAQGLTPVSMMTELWFDPGNTQEGKAHGVSYTSCETCQDNVVRQLCDKPLTAGVASALASEVAALENSVGSTQLKPPLCYPGVALDEAAQKEFAKLKGMKYPSSGVQTLEKMTRQELEDHVAAAQGPDKEKLQRYLDMTAQKCETLAALKAANLEKYKALTAAKPPLLNQPTQKLLAEQAALAAVAASHGM